MAKKIKYTIQNKGLDTSKLTRTSCIRRPELRRGHWIGASPTRPLRFFCENQRNDIKE